MADYCVLYVHLELHGSTVELIFSCGTHWLTVLCHKSIFKVTNFSILYCEGEPHINQICKPSFHVNKFIWFIAIRHTFETLVPRYLSYLKGKISTDSKILAFMLLTHCLTRHLYHQVCDKIAAYTAHLYNKTYNI